ncbi:MAG: hypothetical protein ACE365_05375 [Gammaproteobacteria bacterium]
MTTKREHAKRLETFQRLLSADLSVDEQVELIRSIDVEQLTPEDLISYTHVIYDTNITLDKIPDHVIDISSAGINGPFCDISVPAAFIAASAGVKIAKHFDGNVAFEKEQRKLLELLSIDIKSNPEGASQQLALYGLTFLFSSDFHPILTRFQKAREILQDQPTVFDLLFCLCNPANVNRVIISTANDQYSDLLIETLKLLHKKKAIIFPINSFGQLSENGEMGLIQLEGKTSSTYKFTPEELALKTCSPEELHCNTIEESAQAVRAILGGQVTDGRRDAVLLNAAITIQIGYPESIALDQAVTIAEERLESGRAFERYTSLMQPSHATKN